MRYEVNKAFPYPVLRPLWDRGETADFPGYGFQTTVIPQVSEDGSHIELEISFDIKQPDILTTVESERAEFAVLIYCPTTYYRQYVPSSTSEFTAAIRSGDVDNKVEVRPSIVVKSAIERYEPHDLHPELQGRHYSVPAGGLLAQDHTSDFPASREYLRPITSIFQIVPEHGRKRGHLDILVGDPVQILVSPDDSALLATARGTSSFQPYVMNAIYLPAVMSLLAELIKLEDDDPGDQWFTVVKYKLEAAEIDWSQLVDGRTSIWEASQALLEYPARFLGFLREEESE